MAKGRGDLAQPRGRRISYTGFHPLASAVGLLWGNLAWDLPHHLVVAEEWSGMLGGRLDVVAVRAG